MQISSANRALRLASDLTADDVARSAVARNTLVLLRRAFEVGGPRA